MSTTLTATRNITKPLTALTRLTATHTSASRSSAASAMAQGKLVPDAVVSQLLEARFSQPDCQTRGWLLDGFPRTASQAAHLLADAATRPHAVIEIVADESDIRQRLMYRRRDPYTNRVYNMRTSPPTDAHIFARLESRPDDAPHVVERRLRQYHVQMPPVRDQFRKANVPVIRVQPPRHADAQQVHRCVMQAVETLPVASKIVLAGAPGCGKGTQGALLAKSSGAVHLSTGDLLRDAARDAQPVSFSRRLESIFERFGNSLPAAQRDAPLRGVSALL